jgi:TolB-like protein/Tfp pilus assembly protein PilF
LEFAIHGIWQSSSETDFRRGSMKSFSQELKNRRVYRIALAYIVAGSGLVQLAGSVFPVFHAPDWAQQVFVVLVAFGFPPALLLAWAFEVKGGGIRRTPSSRRVRSGSNHRRPLILGAVGLLVACAAMLAYWWWHPWEIQAGTKKATTSADSRTPASPPISEKSIAVLPFENLSDEKQNAYFTDGVHDEVLTDLSKIADLKVISRSSVMQFKNSSQRNVHEIASALGVIYLVEGTVQRTGGRVRVSAQLIDARTDAHVWGEHYDRDLADIFALESEVAEEIVAQLKGKLSPAEKAAIEQPPTTDLVAYDLYVRAKSLIANIIFNARSNENLLAAVGSLEQAIARDPSFYAAYFQLAGAQDRLYFLGIDHTPARLAMAEAAVQNTVRLRPEAGETHLALAQHYYFCRLDFDHAREELAVATRLLPNESFVFELAGSIDRRQGRWEESTRNFERALQSDPRNVSLLKQISASYYNLRRFKDMARVLDRAVALAPDDIAAQVGRALVDLEGRADVRPLRAVIQTILKGNPEASRNIADQWFYLALCERDGAAAESALAAMDTDSCRRQGVPFPLSWCQGVAARMRGDDAAASAAFTAARAQVEKQLQVEPDYAQALCVLGFIDAALGRKEEAIREGRRAVALLPIQKDAINGALLAGYLGVIYAWTGETDLALEQLAVDVKTPAGSTYGQLRLHPYWDPLRKDPRFQRIVSSMAPN